MTPGRRWAAFLLLLACHVYFLQIYKHFISPNELSRLLLTSAIVDDRTLTIDQAIARYGETQDRASFQGHFYSDKAIGASLLAIPPFTLMRAVEFATGATFTTQTAIFWLRVFTVTIPSLLFLHFLCKLWLLLKPESRYVPHFVFLHLFGTIAFTYSNQFISHNLLGIALFCSAFYLNECRSTRNPLPKHILLAGLFAGLALLLEFPAAVPVAVLCIVAFYVLRKPTTVAYFVIPVLLCAILILGYNYLIFGTPWDVTYRHMTHSFHTTKHAEGIVGMGLPKLEALHGLLFSRHHGLFFISPFLLLAIPGFYQMTKNHTFLANVFILLVLAIILTYSGFSYWIAGWNFGPRYITPVIPFLSTAAFYFADSFLQKGSWNRSIVGAAGLWSVLCVTVATITFPFPPDMLKDPLFFLHFSLLFNNATGNAVLNNPWFFFPLLLCTWILLVFDSAKRTIPFVPVLLALGLASLLFVVAFFSAPDRVAMDYYARGSVYLYLGKYDLAYSEMQLALSAKPDEKTLAMIRKRMNDLGHLKRNER